MHGKNGARQKLTKRQRANVSVTKPKNTQKVKSVCRKPRTVSMNYLGDNAERPIDTDVVEVMLKTVDAIEARHMKGIIIDVGMGVKAKVAKMAKESIKVERSETSKKTYEE